MENIDPKTIQDAVALVKHNSQASGKCLNLNDIYQSEIRDRFKISYPRFIDCMNHKL